MSLDWRDLDLAPGGRSLIEASAGTGKTWTISLLYLRLLLEQQLSPRQIVVTTFTEAAAEELKQRLRRRLLWAETIALGERSATPDVAEDWLRARWDAPAARAGDLDRLRLAMASLEQAPISTLHGLCRRILADQPFACGVDFDGGELVDGAALLEEVATDLWRRVQQGAEDDPLRQALRAAGIEDDRRKQQAWLKAGLQAGIQLDPPALTPLPQDQELIDALDALMRRSDIFAKTAVLRRSLQALADCLRGGAMPSGEDIEKLCEASKGTGVLKAAQALPEVQALLASAAELGSLLARRATQLPMRALCLLTAAGRARRDALLALRRQRSFDSLLETVDAALAREAGHAQRPLADALVAAWPVALVDEFQDTDGLQYAILDRIYRDAGGEPRGRLAMIGDPKQAIYRFRGSDIHAYRRAAAQAEDYLQLDVNQRSSKALIEGCNELFARAGEALGEDSDEAIRYVPVRAAGRADARPYTVDGQPPARAVHIHYLAAPPDAQPQRKEAALTACAAQIVELLNDPRQRIGGERLSAADIAVLLPTAADIADLRAELESRGVACLSAARDSVLRGDTARELQVLLHGVLHRHEAGAVRAAVATRLWGVQLAEMRIWETRPEALQQQVLALHVLAEAWQQQGVLRLIELLLDRLAPRALSHAEGERLLTDLRHLGELLQAEAKHLGGPRELLAWLDAQRRGEEGGEEDEGKQRQLRIESQQPRVKLMTLHSSKGLEFPIVFLPLMWAHGARREFPPYRVGVRERERPTLGFDAEAHARQQEELAEERFRLFYVALTRAEHACHVFALPPLRVASARSRTPRLHDGVEASALDRLLARMQVGAGFDPASLAAIDWIDGWRTPLFARLQAAPQAPGSQAARPLRPRPPGPLPGRHSFTGLLRAAEASTTAIEPEAAAADEPAGELASPLALAVEDRQSARVEAREDDAHTGTGAADVERPRAYGDPSAAGELGAAPTEAETAHPELLALAPLRGAGFGTALHGLLETREHARPLIEQLDHVRHWLRGAGLRRRDFEALSEAERRPSEHGFELAARRIARRLDAALNAPLGLSQSPHRALAEIAEHDQRAELGFEFALSGARLSALAEACSAYGEPDLVPAGERVLHGLMSGKIDLVLRVDGRFHVLDYKGNWLGEQLCEYQGEALRGHMDLSHYRFQALLYTLALDRYLAQRLGTGYRRSEQLGECVYLFLRAAGLRAAGLAADVGIWRQRFADALIEAAQDALAGEIEVGA
jgi:exodeoxyribonuclease V beta subunit